MVQLIKSNSKMLFLLMMGTAFVGLAQSKSKSVSVSLETKWASTPLLLETSEFLASEDNSLFWRFVDSVVAEDPASFISATDEDMYRLALRLAEPLLSTIQMNLLKFALSLRYYSPAIAMYAQAAAEKKTTCDTFVEVNDLITCDMDAMKAYFKLAARQPKPSVIGLDHHYPGSNDAPIVVILYAEIGTAAFSQWHEVLKKKAEQGDIDYVLRHYVHEPPTDKVVLSGYGVELAIKSTEYKAQDDTKVEENKDKDGDTEGEDKEEEEVGGFIFSTLKKQHPELVQNLTEFQQHLMNNLGELIPLKVWQIQDLSLQAAQAVISAPKDEALRVLRDISQNFPMQARLLVKVPVKNELRREMEQNQNIFESSLDLASGESALYINSIRTDLEMDDVFQILDILRSEARPMEGLHSLGFKSSDQMSLLKLELQDAVTDYAVDFRDPSVQFINDLEKDRKYNRWPSSILDLLRPTFPGMLRHIRKNMFHAVFIVNPAERKSRHLIKMVEAFYVHSAPIRIGLVLVVPPGGSVDDTEDAGVALLRAFHYVKSKENIVKALSFLTDVYETVGEQELTVADVREELREELSPGDMDEVFASTTYDTWRQEANDLFSRLGLGAMPQVLLNGIPMKQAELDGDQFEEALVTGIMRMTGELQKAVHAGFLRDDMDVLDYIMTRSNVVSRLNARVMTPVSKYLDFTSQIAEEDLPNDVKTFQSLSPSRMTAVIAQSIKYLVKNDDRILRPLTNWVVADLWTESGRKFCYEAVRQMKSSNNVRLGLIHNSQGEPSDDTSWLVATAIQVALDTLDVGMAKSFVTKLLKEENVAALKSGEKTLDDLAVHGMDTEEFTKKLKSATGQTHQIHRLFVKHVIGFNAGQSGIISSGMVIGPLEENEQFLMEDFGLLEKYVSKLSVSAIQKKIAALDLDSDKASDLVMKVSALLMSNPQKGKRKEFTYSADTYSVLTLPPADPDKPAYDIVAILDPVSRSAQKYTPLIMALQQVINVNVKIFMNCREKLSEMPLKNFYRYVIEPELMFSEDTRDVSGAMVSFESLPSKALLTLGMDAPESWLVESVRSPYDLDNIYLEEVENNVFAEFELEYLLLEGHCYDSTSGQPPRGLQFILGTKNTPAVVDTIVMANLGYFQLKATPGSWILRVRPGRSADIYSVTSHEFTDSPSDSPEVIVVMNSFKTKIIKVKVNKKPSKEHEDLMGESPEEKKGLWDSISNLLGMFLATSLSQRLPVWGKTLGLTSTFSGGTQDSETDSDKHLNIFSLASGHLYERFLRIMMTSVLKHTKSKVKFWFLKNYLSPSFKEFIPHMAKEYNFEYELIQYKWPRWLRQQSEKQRIIWGYKILFLDVLFPLSVDKIIFVDADQIVRADLKELHDLDLEGAPYGYTPFCDSRKEMDGFRFWKSGYWASHLAGRRYHISALYVVDLKKFRKIAAGDRLRGQYQGLSQDPNSLSNLDQDLPNNMIHQVAIKSLPQEWLWCETWCSTSELSSAKTIDLCNNPLTKEPKLQAAVRIVSEWKDYDDEVKELWDKWHKGSSTGSTTRSTIRSTTRSTIQSTTSTDTKETTTSSSRTAGELRVEL